MDLGRGGEGESVQPFRLSENSWSHHFMAPQEWRVCFPPVDTTLKGCDEMRNSAKEGKVSEGGYEGAPACTEQLLVGSVSRSGWSFACSQLPSLSPSCSEGEDTRRGQSNWACQGHPSAAKRMAGRWMMWKGEWKKNSFYWEGKCRRLKKNPRQENACFLRCKMTRVCLGTLRALMIYVLWVLSVL